jgi:hypothetical protein
MVVCMGATVSLEPRGSANMAVPRGKPPDGEMEIFDERG